MRVVDMQSARLESFYAAVRADFSSLFFAAKVQQPPVGRSGTTADPARPVNPAPHRME
jgi:hypothetical protein